MPWLLLSATAVGHKEPRQRQRPPELKGLDPLERFRLASRQSLAARRVFAEGSTIETRACGLSIFVTG